MSFLDDLERWAAIQLARTTGTKFGRNLERLLRGEDTAGFAPVSKQGFPSELRRQNPGVPEDLLVVLAGFAYLPLSDDAIYGWGEPYNVNLPLGTVQTTWAPENRIYRRAEGSGTEYTVTHDTDQTASGRRWWSNETNLFSWEAIAGWASIAPSAGMVPSGRKPIFENADILTWSPADCDQIFCAGHDGTYLYIGYRHNWELYFARSEIVLGGGTQTPTWAVIGPCTEQGTITLDNWCRWADFDATFTNWVANLSGVKGKTGWNKNIRYFREYQGTLDWNGLNFTADVSQDAVDGIGEDSLTKSWVEHQSSETIPQEFLPEPPPFDYSGIGGTLPANIESSYAISSTIQTWYDRATDELKRKKFELDIKYDHVLAAGGITWIQRAWKQLGEDSGDGYNVYFCAPECGSRGQTIITGQWESRRSFIDLAVDARIMAEDSIVISTPIARQTWGTESAGTGDSYFQEVTEVGSLPCDDPLFPQDKCGDFAEPEDYLVEFGAQIPYTPTSDQTPLNEEQRTCASPPAFGDSCDAKGNMHAIVTDLWWKVTNDGPQEIPLNQAQREWKVRQIDQTELLNLSYQETFRNANFYVSAPSMGSQTTLGQESDWDDYFSDVVNANIYGFSHDYQRLNYQPAMRLPNGGYFCAMAQPDQNPAVPSYAGSWYYGYSFSGGDLVALTQMTGANPRFSIYGYGTGTPTTLIVAGVENLVGVIN